MYCRLAVRYNISYIYFDLIKSTPRRSKQRLQAVTITTPVKVPTDVGDAVGLPCVIEGQLKNQLKIERALRKNSLLRKKSASVLLEQQSFHLRRVMMISSVSSAS